MTFSTSNRVRARASLLLIVGLLVGATPAVAQDAATADAGFTLTVLHTNDTHAHIEQFDGSTTTCSEETEAEGGCIRGVARRATEINRWRNGENGSNVILVDAGDQFQGTLFFNEYKGAEAAQFMNELGYQAMAIGNHEFDNGPGDLAAFIGEVSFPVLSSNVDATAQADLNGKIAASTILDVNGERWA